MSKKYELTVDGQTYTIYADTKKEAGEKNKFFAANSKKVKEVELTEEEVAHQLKLSKLHYVGAYLDLMHDYNIDLTLEDIRAKVRQAEKEGLATKEEVISFVKGK